MKGMDMSKITPRAALPLPLVALAAVTLQANHEEWADATFARRPAKAGEEPDKALRNKFQVQSVLDNAGEARAKLSDANHFLYLIKANQLFCKEHLGPKALAAAGDGAWLAGYQGYGSPERQQWCQPGDKTRQVLAYHAELLEKLGLKKKAPAKATAKKAPATKAPAKKAAARKSA